MRVPHPQFEGQTKTKLGNSEVEGIVNSAVGEFLGKYFEETPRSAKTIIKKGMLAAEAREAARKAKALLRERKGALSPAVDCLANCVTASARIWSCELYLVEGDSAGGSAEGGRLREYQAILPLRGKIINAYKSREDKVLANEEVRSMIQAIGAGIGVEQDISKRRYNKIIIMTDADVDGSHIRTLLLCFFYRQMYELVSKGHVYVAQPPLFRVKQKKSTYYIQTDEEMKTQLLEKGLGDSVLDAGDGRSFEGEEMSELCRILAGMEESLVVLERRGIGLRTHAERIDFESGKLPVYHVFVGYQEHWLHSRKQLEALVAKSEEETGSELTVDDPTDQGNGEAVEDAGTKLQITEFHEVRTINSGLADLSKYGFDIQSLIPQDRTGIEDPRYVLRRGENEIPLEDLRGRCQRFGRPVKRDCRSLDLKAWVK